MSITIRLASSNDIDAIFDIRTSVHENHLSIEQLAERGITHQAIAEAIEAEPCLWIAEYDGQALGFAMADRADGCLFAVFVRPEYEGQGIGRALLEQAEAYLFVSHSVIWLETDGKAAQPTFIRREDGGRPRHCRMAMSGSRSAQPDCSKADNISALRREFLCFVFQSRPSIFLDAGNHGVEAIGALGRKVFFQAKR